jgi:hypothetical protein
MLVSSFAVLEADDTWPSKFTHDVARRKRALGAPKGAAYGQAANDVDISERG